MIKIFAERLKKLRKEKRYTSKELAEYLGIGQRAYLYYESAVHYPDVPGLIKLADFFEVSIDYLLGRTEEQESV
ncbi:MAG: helix-turn-helix transcriptional regulator [Oscillibacter sp.]|nr:helix-turn-helix transcriptional regulator [Oscillibacter sp.]